MTAASEQSVQDDEYTVAPVAHELPNRPLRIVFSLLHAGYLRHYAEPIKILAGRGHSIHLALEREDAKDRGDDRLLERLLADCPSVTASVAPRRSPFDGWRPIAWLVRAFVDVLRYGDPRYRDADALRRRAASHVRERLDDARIDPLSRRLVLRLVESIAQGRQPAHLGRVLRAAAAVEDAIPPYSRTIALIENWQADLVLASPVVDFASPQVEFIKSARRLGIPSAVCVASWDNLTNKGLLRVLPDRVLVWNELQREELVEMHRVDGDSVVITGGQKFDPWFELTASTTRKEFSQRVGLDPRRPFLLYVCSSRFIAADEVPAVRRWINAVRGVGGELGGHGILIRPHPQNAQQWARADLSDLENLVIWPREGEYPDDGAAQAEFFDSIFHSSAVVGINTSALIEAGIIGRPVYTVLSADFASTQVDTLHFQYLRHENGGFVHEARDLDTHVDQLQSGLGREDDAERIGRFIESFVRPRGRSLPAAPIVAEEIESVARAGVGPRPGAVFPRLLIRGALTPVALALSGVAHAPRLAGAGKRRLRRLGS